MAINLLSEDLINKIAAGEVIERPASVVKELVENSLDAAATQITIDISDSGKKLIKVVDNGSGMSEEDTRKSIIRHATSKISNQDDLFAIATLGFRGEALASIAAVSQLSVLTKQSGIEGFNLVVEGGEMISSGVVAAEQGTTLEVANLFFNTPARQKFLKTDQVELRHIIEVVTRYALLRPDVAFLLRHDKHELLRSPVAENLRDNIAAIYGVKVAKEMLEVNYESELVKIYGYTSKPQEARNDKQQQVLFVNGRWVKSDEISKAVYDAYHSMLFVNRHPLFVLTLEIDVAKVDVNVHPNKSEIKIERVKEICLELSENIRKVLGDNNLIPNMDVHFESVGIVKRPKYDFEQSKQVTLELPRVELVEVEKRSTEEHVTPEEEIKVARKKLPPIKLLGQIHKTFFIAETIGGAFFIDQHAAHERVLYERYMVQYRNKQVAVQRLLQGEILEFSAAEKVTVEENIDQLLKFGFTLEGFGENSYVVKTVPLLFGRIQPKEIVFEVLTMLKEGRQKIMETKEDIVTRMACRSAVMAGEELTNLEMEKILRDLEETEFPYTCPHGRPTMIKTTADELEKKFKRKG